MFKGWKKNSKGVSANAHLEQARQTAEKLGLSWDVLKEPEAEQAPEIPPGLDFIWETFIDLNNSRSAGFSANPISWTEIRSWSWLHRIRLDAFEIHMLKMLDLKWLQIINATEK